MSGSPALPLTIGRFTLIDKIGSGGMASVYAGRMSTAAGFARTVAIKRLHPHLAEDRDLRLMLLDEALITMRIRHPNVLPTIDVAQLGEELLIVMEYVVGVTLARLIKCVAERGEASSPEIVATIVSSALHGLHAAHEERDDGGAPLNVVHRDVSPQNILVGADGATRMLDFGIAKAAGRMHSTRDGQAKGKLAYMAPEQVETLDLDRRADVFAAGIVLWEALTLKHLFAEASEAVTIARVLRGVVRPPSSVVPGLDPRFDAICARALQRQANERYPTAREMALDLEACGTVPASAVASYVERSCGEDLKAASTRAHRVEVEPAPSVPRARPRRRALALAVPAVVIAGALVALRASRAREDTPASSGVAKRATTAARTVTADDDELARVPVSAEPALPSAKPPGSIRGPTPRAAPITTAASAAPKCTVVPVPQPDGTLDFQERCE